IADPPRTLIPRRDWLARLRMLSGARFRTLEPTPPYAQSFPPHKVKALVPCMPALLPKLRSPHPNELLMVNVTPFYHPSSIASSKLIPVDHNCQSVGSYV